MLSHYDSLKKRFDKTISLKIYHEEQKIFLTKFQQWWLQGRQLKL